MQLIIETRSGGFSHWAKEAERVVKTLLTLDRFRLLHWSHHQQCPDHHSLAEVNEIHVSKKETAGPESRYGYLRSKMKWSGPPVGTAQNENRTVTRRRRAAAAAAAAVERWTARGGHRLLGVSICEAASEMTGKGL